MTEFELKKLLEDIKKELAEIRDAIGNPITGGIYSEERKSVIERLERIEKTLKK